MQKIAKCSLVLFLALSFTACGKSEKTSKTTTPETAKQKEQTEQRVTLNKAKKINNKKAYFLDENRL